MVQNQSIHMVDIQKGKTEFQDLQVKQGDRITKMDHKQSKVLCWLSQVLINQDFTLYILLLIL